MTTTRPIAPVFASGFPPASITIDSVRGFFEKLAGEGSVLSVRLKKVSPDGPKGKAAKQDLSSASGSSSSTSNNTTKTETEGAAEPGSTDAAAVTAATNATDAGSDSAAASGSSEGAGAADADSGSRAAFDGSAWVEFKDKEKADKVAAEGKYEYELVKQTKVEGEAEAEVKEDSKYNITVISKREFLASLKKGDRKAGGGNRDVSMKADRGEKRRRTGDKDGSSAEGGAAEGGQGGRGRR